ncbi:hypothetical protein SAMN05518861_14819, partial [Mesorhizobium sp. YR577]
MSNHLFDAIRKAAVDRNAAFILATGGRVWSY